MTDMATENPIPRESVTSYRTSWEHLLDELHCLDLALQTKVASRNHPSVNDPLAPFKGLVISDAEAAELLSPAAPIDEINDERQLLIEAHSRQRSVIEARRKASLDAGVHLSLACLGQLFHLTRFEEQCLLLCLAPELDRKYERIYAYLQDDATRKKPTVDLLLQLLCEGRPQELAARVVFGANAPLLRCKLAQLSGPSADGPVPLLSRALKVEDRIVDFLLGSPQSSHIDARLEHCARRLAPREIAVETAFFRETVQRIHGFIHSYWQTVETSPRNTVFYLRGRSSSNQQLLAEAFCSELGLPLLLGDVEKMMAEPVPFAELSWLLGREALLQPAALCLENMDCLLADPAKNRGELQSILDAASTFSRFTFLLGTLPWNPPGSSSGVVFLAVDVAQPGMSDCAAVWEQQLRSVRVGEDVQTAELASKFRLGPSQIHNAVEAAENLARWRSAENCRITMQDLSAACRAQSGPKLATLARKLSPKKHWTDIVLPEDQLMHLKELCEQAKHRQLVYGAWGFDRKLSLGKGLNALFSGPPGTGKTMAAEVIATELELDLYQIDLSQVVSKYIGETEKNLHQIFLEAHTSNAILFFDEADALFGKRSEVKDAHDRYANIETGYLLQKMEEYEGIAILATNLRQHLDEAFVRRLHFIVEFPFPNHEMRKQIWEVTFPKETPLSGDVDLEVLARDIKLPGGNIRNIALAAAFRAAGNGQTVCMSHLMQAAWREHQKLGRTWQEAAGAVS